MSRSTAIILSVLLYFGTPFVFWMYGAFISKELDVFMWHEESRLLIASLTLACYVIGQVAIVQEHKDAS